MDERDVTAAPPATAIAVAVLPYVGQWRMNGRQNRIRDHGRCPSAAPCRLNDENSRRKVQNVRRGSSADRRSL